MKRRLEPLILEGLSAAIQRLPWKDERIQRKYLSVKAGFGGEKQLDRVFENYNFQMTYHVFFDLSLISSANFQIDTLLITPSYAIVFEVKNIAGELKVLKNPPQLQRVLENGEVSSFNSPITQVQNNCDLLQDWFQSRNIALPIYGVVVLAYAKQRIELFDTSVPFLFPEDVPTFIRNLPITPTILDEIQFEQAASDLLASHREFIPSPICLTFPELANDIQQGVFCPFCNQSLMKKYIKGWYCLSCKETSKDAHKQAIRDWFFLFGGEMTNKDCRDFLGIENRQVAYRLLKGMDLEAKGSKRNRSYHFNYLMRR